jgi:hypothetical protein
MPEKQKPSTDTDPQMSPSSTMYHGLASQAEQAGDKKLAERFRRHAQSVAWDDEGGKEAVINREVGEILRTFQILVDWGAEAATSQANEFYRTLDDEKGVKLFLGFRTMLALPILQEVYQKLGVTNVREKATQQDLSYGKFEVTGYEIPVTGGITLLETQEHMEQDTEDDIMYELWARKE